MMDLPPPTQVQVVANASSPLESIHITQPVVHFRSEERAEFEAFAGTLRAVFDDGFQWDDLFEIVRRAFVYMDNYTTFTPNKKRAGVVYIIDHLIDITDTPFLPDAITDPIMQAFVPAYIDLVHWGMTYKRPFPTEEYDETATAAFMDGLSQYAVDNINWEKLFEGLKSSIHFFSKHLNVSNEKKKEAVFHALCYILDITVWPFFLDPILDPLIKVLMRPIINMTIDALFEGESRP